ncbi:MAG: ATP-binding protein [Clostridia bacterium]
MKKRILTGMCITALVSIVLTMLFTTLAIFEDSTDSLLERLEIEADYIKIAYDDVGIDYFDELDEDLGGRITIINSDGTVLFDSIADETSMENHANRIEVISALEAGTGSDTRSSDTLGDRTVYYAVLANDGTVIRVSGTIQSVFNSMKSLVFLFIFISLVVCIIAFLVSNLQTKYIVKPINEINLDFPQSNEIYEELNPLVARLQQQKHQIDENIEILRLKQKEFTTIIENMKEGLIVVDKNAQVLSYNNSAIRLCGFQGGFSVGTSVYVMNRNVEFSNAVEKALKGQRAEQTIDIKGRCCKFFINPVDHYDDFSGVIIIIMDITEQASREELRREFTANVSHELKTPLTSISGYAEIIKTGIAKDKDIKGFAEKIYTESQKLISLVIDIIKLSRLDETEGKIMKEECDLFAIAKIVVQRLEATAYDASVDLSITGEKSVIHGVPNALEEMIYNICDNAIKYNNAGGKVSVSVLHEYDKIKLVIADNGIGIPNEDKDRIFERFYRVDKSHYKKTGGTGLGLSIVKHCVSLHGGEIDLQSRLGKGTTITIMI